MSLIRELIEHTGLSASELRHVIYTAPARYKVYEIPKRHGAGVRVIAQPSRELKAIQHYILQHKLPNFPVHDSAAAYVKNKNIKQNAERHRQGDCILKLDFRDFFPSIKVADWEKFARAHENQGIDLDDLKSYSKALFWSGERGSYIPRRLSIGAPTSPLLSNILLYEFDMEVRLRAEARGVTYTRYADDITASGKSEDDLLAFETDIRRFTRALKHPRLTFNEEKRGLFKKGQRRLVTGLVITPVQRISIGRERKRLISAMLFRSSRNELDICRKSQLKGLLGFCVDNEPDFLNRMRTKYGNEVVEASLKFHAPRRRDLGQLMTNGTS